LPAQDLTQLSAAELRAGYSALEFSPAEVLDALIAQIGAVDTTINAFTTLALERAREEAREATLIYVRGEARGTLTGIPIGVKDIFDTEGIRTTYGSRMFADYVPATDASAVQRARAAGAIVIGKTATHEFAWGITTDNPHFGPCRNPWDLDRVPGGSSGGSAAALATRQIPIALGTDTGGSIRIPAAYCGVVGLKPTYGRISAAGAMPLARTLDHPGPMARTPADAALLLEACAGPDPLDPATAHAPPYAPDETLDDELRGLSVGVSEDLHRVALAPAVQIAFDRAVRVIKDLGATVVEVGFVEADAIDGTFATIQRAEALFTHARRGLFPGRRAEYGQDVLGRLEAATEVTLPEYLGAIKVRDRIRAEFARVFGTVDLLLTPVSAASAVEVGGDRVLHLGRPADFRDVVMPYTVPQDLAGLPACSLPAGVDNLGIPIGVQITGPPWSESRVLRAAAAFASRSEPLPSPPTVVL
jgi:aspartyl-tRNA(Asn)/glutamyl-tRNA(Gln) amidotransferase subunit A